MQHTQCVSSITLGVLESHTVWQWDAPTGREHGIWYAEYIYRVTDYVDKETTFLSMLIGIVHLCADFVLLYLSILPPVQVPTCSLTILFILSK
jgi:hypothetical protein